MPTRRLILVIAGAALSLVTGCGGGGDDEGAVALLDRLPSNSDMVAAVDLSEARKKLKLPDDADLALGGNEVEQRLIIAGAYALPHLQRPYDLPILEVLDHKRIQAAATGGPEFDEQLTVIRTSQPPSDVLEGLEKKGYKRDGDLLVSDDSAVEVLYRAAAEADGLLLLASDGGVLRKALTETDGGAESPAGRVVRDELKGPVRYATVHPDADCLRGLGAEDTLDPAGGAFLLDIAGSPDADRARLGKDPYTERFLEGTRFLPAKVEGDRLRVPFSYDASNPLPGPLGLVSGDVPSSTFYDCE